MGLILIPPNRELETIVFHFGPNVCIRSGLLRSGVIRIEPINRDTAVTVVEPDYTAVLAGGEHAMGGGNLAAVIRMLRSYGFRIKGYVPSGAIYVDHEGNIYDAHPKGVPRKGYGRFDNTNNPSLSR